MVPLSPNPSDRELVLAVIAGKTTPEAAIPLLRGNDPTVKGLILEQLAKQTIQVAQAIGLVNRLDELAMSRARAVSGGGAVLRCKVSPKGHGERLRTVPMARHALRGAMGTPVGLRR